MYSKLTSCLKLKRGGNGRPLGRRAFGSRSSSKKGCAHASNYTKWIRFTIITKKNFKFHGNTIMADHIASIDFVHINIQTYSSAAQTWWVLKQPWSQVNGLWRHTLVENLKPTIKFGTAQNSDLTNQLRGSSFKAISCSKLPINSSMICGNVANMQGKTKNIHREIIIQAYIIHELLCLPTISTTNVKWNRQKWNTLCQGVAFICGNLKSE